MSSPGLKRPLELEQQHLNTDFMGLKKRCGVGTMHQNPNQFHHQQQQLHQLQQQNQLQLDQQQQNLTQHHHYHPPPPPPPQQPQHNLTSSPFKGSILAPVGDEVARVIKDEIINNQSQQNQNRDQQNPHNQSNNQSGQHNVDHSSQHHNHQHHHHHHQHNNQHQQDLPVLTIRQTQIICEKLIKDREQKLRQEYDRILMSKLAEQYETFVKYVHDCVEKPNSQHQASYLS